jgi:hypothetical protein
MSGNWFYSEPPKGQMATRTQKGPKGQDISVEVWEAPIIIVATKCGIVTLSRWLNNHQRWNMLATGEEPLCWQPWPEHPGEPQ